MANPMINSGSELLQFSGDDDIEFYAITNKKDGSCYISNQTKCVCLGIFSFIMLVLLVVGVYVSFGMWDPAEAQRWRDTTCHVPHADCPVGFDRPPVILVSMDGFRASYLKRNLTPNLRRLSQCGVSAPFMSSVYPAKTFVNHYSIVTGLYPESHGVIDNWMFDPDIGKLFTMTGKEYFNNEWWGGEPIWNTVTKNDKVSATFFIPGTDVDIGGMRPKYWNLYNRSVPYENRVDTVLRWLDMPKGDRPDFITLYFEEPDKHGHMTGPDSSAVDHQLRRMDRLIGRLMDGLKKRRLHRCTNIVIVADHGMSSTSCKRLMRLDKYVNTSNMLVFDGPSGRINTEFKVDSFNNVVKVSNPEDESEVVRKLRCKWPELTPLFKKDLPKRFHYARNKRIDNIILNVRDRWLVSRGKPRKNFCEEGRHGYDPIVNSIQAMFMAYGPSFKSGHRTKPFLNVELYNLMTDLLDIHPAPNNGTPGALHDLLRHPRPEMDVERPPGHHYTTCTFPISDEIYHPRANKSECKCRVPSGTTIEDSDHELNLTSARRDAIVNGLVPFGVPVLRQPDNVCILTQRRYVNGYSHVYQTPLWVAYVVDSAPPLLHDDHCLRPDVRLASNKPNCGTYNKLMTGDLRYEHLYPAWMERSAVEKMDATILTNVVPMYDNFKNGIWHHLMEKIRQWQVDLSTIIHVFVGPAYDYNYDGLKDHKDDIEKFVPDTTLPVASHFYAVLTHCVQYGLTCCNQYDNLAVILPHLSELPQCTNLTEYLMEHTARVRDVELITGLEFYPKLPQNVTLSLVSRVVDRLWS